LELRVRQFRRQLAQANVFAARMRINDVQKLCRSASAILNYPKGIGARRHERARQHTCHDGDRGQQE